MTFRIVVLQDPVALAANQTALKQVLESVRQQQDDFTAHLHKKSEQEMFERYLQAYKAFSHERLEVIRLAAGTASEQQAQVSREIDRSLISIRDLSVQTSAGAVQIHSTSKELSLLATGLRGYINRFRL